MHELTLGTLHRINNRQHATSKTRRLILTQIEMIVAKPTPAKVVDWPVHGSTTDHLRAFHGYGLIPDGLS